jgi:hypothetical protein
MSSLARSVLGAALLLTGVSAVMAASGTPVAAQSAQTGAATAAAAPAANQTVQTGASTATAAPNNAPVAAQPQQPRKPAIADNSDPYGGNDPNSTAGARAFFTPQY